MKNIILIILFSVSALAQSDVTRFKSIIANGSLSVGSSAVASASAAIDVTSTTKGALLPRMTLTQRNAITATPLGLTVFNTTDSKFNYYTGTTWLEYGQAIGISVPDASAIFQASSSTKGFLIPRMASSSISAIPSPATGLLVFNTTTDHFNYYFSSNWIEVGSALGTTTIPNGAAALDVNSTTQGVIFPRLTTAQRDAIVGPPSGLLLYNSDTSKYQYYNGVSWKDFGSGSGSGSGKNFVTNFDFEDNTSGYATYKDAAGVAPVDGTGGSPSVTLTRTSSSLLEGTHVGRFSHPASNTQGEGFSYDFTIDGEQKTRPLTFDFSYRIASGSFNAGTDSTAGDLVAYLYDKTNSRLIQPVPYKLDCVSSISCHFTGDFQASADSVDYRFIIHSASTAATAYDVDFDSLSVSHQNSARGPPTQFIGYRATDSSLAIPNASEVTLVPSTVSYDTTGSYNSGTGEFTAPTAGYYNVFSNIYNGGTLTINTGQIELYFEVNGVKVSRTLNDITQSTAGGVTIATTVHANAGDILRFRIYQSNGTSRSFVVDSQISLSNGGSQGNDGAPIAMRSKLNSFTHTSSGSELIVTGWSTADFDTTQSFNPSTGYFTCPIAGYYRMSATVQHNNNSTGSRYFSFRKNDIAEVYSQGIAATVANGTVGVMVIGTANIKCNAGDTLSIYSFQNTGGSDAFGGGGFTHLEIEKIANPQSISNSETVVANYSMNGNKTVATDNQINYDTKIDDTHNAVTTGTGWKFTAPIAGYYRFSGSTTTTTGAVGIYVWKNGASYQRVGWALDTAADNFSGMIKLNAGDYIDFRPDSGITFNGGSTNFNHVEINRVGN